MITHVQPGMSPLTAEQIERLAHKRVGAKLGWYVHAALYLVTNALVFVISRFGIFNEYLPSLPLVGWGLVLALHGIAVFLIGTGALRENVLERERDRLRRQSRSS